MSGEELKKLGEEYPDFEFKFSFSDGGDKWPNVRSFDNIELADVGHSNKVVILSGEEIVE